MNNRMKPAALLFLFFLSCCASVLRADDTELSKWFIAQWRSQGFVVGKPKADFFDYMATQLDDVWDPSKSAKPAKIYAYDLAFFYDVKRGVPDFGLIRYRTADGDLVVQTLNTAGKTETKRVTLTPEQYKYERDFLFELYRPRRSAAKLPKENI
jgi:hypothetical protein